MLATNIVRNAFPCVFQKVVGNSRFSVISQREMSALANIQIAKTSDVAMHNFSIRRDFGSGMGEYYLGGYDNTTFKHVPARKYGTKGLESYLGSREETDAEHQVEIETDPNGNDLNHENKETYGLVCLSAMIMPPGSDGLGLIIISTDPSEKISDSLDEGVSSEEDAVADPNFYDLSEKNEPPKYSVEADFPMREA